MVKRAQDEMRSASMIPHYIIHPEGSVLCSFGATKVICTASVEQRPPKWLSGSGKGWVTAEYDMLPRATNSRKPRDSHKGRINGRTQEIGRLIGRSLRAVVDLRKLGERSICVDCDVLQADGGTRTAAITGGYVALAMAIQRLEERKEIPTGALKDHVAAISVGIVDGEPQLDLDYDLDSRAEVDMNVVMTGSGELAEVQGTGEGATFNREQLNTLMDLAFAALPQLVELQKAAIATPFSQDPQVIRLS